MKKWTADDFEIKSSTIKGAGMGLFSKVHIGLEETIGYYTGDIIDEDEFNSGRWSENKYILWVCKTHIIVGEGPRSNYTRYINHSKENANAFLMVSTRWKTARFEAIADIKPGDEIFFDYGDYYWENEETPPGQPEL